MQTYNQSGEQNIMPLLMNFTTPTPIQETTPIEFSYDEENQVSYELMIVGTRSLRHPSTYKGGEYHGVDAKNEIDDSKSTRNGWF